jgi:hypothetical protein
MKNAKGFLIELGEELASERDAASDLWSWLPSHSVAETHHGDYAGEFMPSVRDVMIEASMYLAHLRYPLVPLTREKQEWFDTCPCGEGCEANKAAE